LFRLGWGIRHDPCQSLKTVFYVNCCCCWISPKFNASMQIFSWFLALKASLSLCRPRCSSSFHRTLWNSLWCWFSIVQFPFYILSTWILCIELDLFWKHRQSFWKAFYPGTLFKQIWSNSCSRFLSAFPSSGLLWGLGPSLGKALVAPCLPQRLSLKNWSDSSNCPTFWTQP